MGAVIGLTFFFGIPASGPVFLHRAGLFSQPGVNWREFLLPNLAYFLLTFDFVTPERDSGL